MSEDDSLLEVSIGEALAYRQLAHQQVIEFFSVHDPRSDLFSYGPGLDYIGLAMSSLEAQAIPCTIESNNSEKFRNINFNAHDMPALLDGTITFRQKPIPQDTVLAISINGTVRAVTKPYAASRKDAVSQSLVGSLFPNREK